MREKVVTKWMFKYNFSKKNTQTLIKTYHLRFLKSVTKVLVNIFLGLSNFQGLFAHNRKKIQDFL